MIGIRKEYESHLMWEANKFKSDGDFIDWAHSIRSSSLKEVEQWIVKMLYSHIDGTDDYLTTVLEEVKKAEKSASILYFEVYETIYKEDDEIDQFDFPCEYRIEGKSVMRYKNGKRTICRR